MNKWNNINIYPDAGRKILLDTNHGKYTGISKGAGNFEFTQSIHYNGPITVPALYCKRWRYMSDKEYLDRRGFEIIKD